MDDGEVRVLLVGAAALIVYGVTAVGGPGYGFGVLVACVAGYLLGRSGKPLR